MNTAARTQRDHIRAMLADLELPGAREVVDDVLSEVDGGLKASDAIARYCMRRLNCATTDASPPPCALHACR